MILSHFRRLFSTVTVRDRLLLTSQSKMATKCLSTKVDNMENCQDIGKFKPVSHVIFDMDGLLLDTEPLYREAHHMLCQEFGKSFNFELNMEVQGMLRGEMAQHIIDKLNLPISVDDYLFKVNLLYKDTFCNAKLKEDTEIIYKRIITEITESYGKKYTRDVQLKVLGTTEQMTASTVIKECGLPITLAEFIDDFHKRQKTALPNANLMEGVERLVKHLHSHNVPIAIATSSGEESVKAKTRNHVEFFKLFDHVVMGSSDPDVKQGKPAPDVFQVCADRFSDKPSHDKCLVFEDAPNGVTGAIAANMQCVMVPDPELPKERTSHATLVLKSLLDFKPEYFGLPPF